MIRWDEDNRLNLTIWHFLFWDFVFNNKMILVYVNVLFIYFKFIVFSLRQPHLYFLSKLFFMFLDYRRFLILLKRLRDLNLASFIFPWIPWMIIDFTVIIVTRLVLLNGFKNGELRAFRARKMKTTILTSSLVLNQYTYGLLQWDIQ